MRLCTNCISCMELPLLPKRARFLSEPPPNRLQISAQTTALPTMIRADGQVENKGKPHPKHLNSFYLKCERSPAFSCGRLHNTLLVLLCYKKGAPQKGQPESCRSRIRAMVCRSVAMDQGLCRSTRTGRTPRVESRRHFGDG